MPDSFLGLFWFGVTQRSGAAQAFGVMVDRAELDLGEADPPITALVLGEADEFANERLTDEDVLARPFDRASASSSTSGGSPKALISAARVGDFPH